MWESPEKAEVSIGTQAESHALNAPHKPHTTLPNRIASQPPTHSHIRLTATLSPDDDDDDGRAVVALSVGGWWWMAALISLTLSPPLGAACAGSHRT